MNSSRWPLSLMLSVIMLNAHAQGIYKSVGPDGKVTYSDRPPADAKGKFDVIQTPNQSQTPPPAAQDSSSYSAAESPAMSSRGAKKAAAASKPQSETAAAAKIDPAVEGAIIGVLGIEDLVRQTEDICLKALPTSFKRYSGAADGWRQRNAAMVRQARQALAKEFSAAEGRLIESGIQTKNRGMFAPVLNASMKAKIDWCDQSAGEMEKGGMDVNSKPKLYGPLKNYDR